MIFSSGRILDPLTDAIWFIIHPVRNIKGLCNEPVLFMRRRRMRYRGKPPTDSRLAQVRAQARMPVSR